MPQPRHIYASSLSRRQRRWTGRRRREGSWLPLALASSAGVALVAAALGELLRVAG